MATTKPAVIKRPTAPTGQTEKTIVANTSPSKSAPAAKSKLFL